MSQTAFFAFIAAIAAVAFTDWRRGWLFLLLVGTLQDPARKLTPGMPVTMTYAAMIVYAAVLFGGRRDLLDGAAEFGSRFSRVARLAMILGAALALATLNGLATFGLAYWKAPLLSLFTYLAPAPAVIVGYVYLRREDDLFRLLTIYAGITSLMLVGAAFEYFRVDVPALGLVAASGDQLRFLPGIQLRMISGFYRAPDIMGWHAATLTAVAIAMAVRSGFGMRAWLWLAITGWGFFNCLISGRRKAIYFVITAAAVFIWRYFRRLKISQIVAAAVVVVVLLVTVQYLDAEKPNTYARAATTSRMELQQRVGGVQGTLSQSGILGSGLGYATQGVYHLLPPNTRLGWQEGGVAKVTAELGLPGLAAVVGLAIAAASVFLLLTRVGDVPGSSQFVRVMLFALTVANTANFAASAQAYTDPLLGLLTSFFVGALFATATLDERLTASAAQVQPALGATPSAAA